MPVAKREPRWGIYGEAWDAARTRVPTLVDPELRVAYGAVLDAVEEGWAIVRPVLLAADAIQYGAAAQTTEARWAALFAEFDIADAFRGVAGHRAACVPGPDGYSADPGRLDAPTELELVERYLHVLGMAAVHPAFPASMGDLLPAACEAFTAWLARFRIVFAPVDAAETAYVCDGAAPPLVASA